MRGVRARQAVVAAVVSLALAFSVVSALATLRAPARLLAHSDFGAFYCAARVARDGADPYREEPLRTCEVERVYAPGGVAYADAGIDPAPFPPYFFAALSPFTALPYERAGTLWHVLLAVATAIAVWAIASLCRIPWWTVAPAVAVSVFNANFFVGQIPPLVFCAFAVAALLLERGKSVFAACVAALALVEPHVAAPVLLSLGCWRTATRIPLITIGLATLLLGWFDRSILLWPEYLRSVLPIHAVAEAPVAIQYSTSWLATLLGVDEALATRIGMAQYVALVAFAIATVPFVVRRLRSPAAIVFYPAAAAVFGGAFIHYGQVTLALLFAFLVAGRAARRADRIVAWAAVAAIALPWGGWGSRSTTALVLLVAAAVAYESVSGGLWRRVAGTVAILALYVAVNVAIRHAPYDAPRISSTRSGFAARRYDGTLASTVMGLEWRNDAEMVRPSWQLLGQKLPVWLGAIVVLALPLVRRGAAQHD